MHKKKVITGAGIVAVGIILVSGAIYGRFILDCYDISDRFDRKFEPNACDFGWAFYLITALSLLTLGFGGWLLFLGLRSISLATLRKS